MEEVFEELSNKPNQLYLSLMYLTVSDGCFPRLRISALVVHPDLNLFVYAHFTLVSVTYAETVLKLKRENDHTDQPPSSSDCALIPCSSSFEKHSSFCSSRVRYPTKGFILCELPPPKQ